MITLNAEFSAKTLRYYQPPNQPTSFGKTDTSPLLKDLKENWLCYSWFVLSSPLPESWFQLWNNWVIKLTGNSRWQLVRVLKIILKEKKVRKNGKTKLFNLMLWTKLLKSIITRNIMTEQWSAFADRYHPRTKIKYSSMKILKVKYSNIKYAHITITKLWCRICLQSLFRLPLLSSIKFLNLQSLKWLNGLKMKL